MYKKSLSRLPSLLMLLALLANLLPGGVALADTTPVFINEIHYDNTGTDAGEAIEVAGPAGTDLSGWSLVLYNGANGLVYDTNPLSGVIPDLGGGFGVMFVTYPVNGIQNGSPDGVALVNGSTVVQFLSYEGSFTAVGGPADGMTSTDIGVSENGSGAVGNSLQLTGAGEFYEDFTWAGEAPNTFGAFNTGQTFGEAPEASLVINEIDYDQPGTDAAEFVEIKNTGSGNAILSEYTLELVNGTGGGATIYQSFALPSVTLAAGGYFVVCGDAANVANCDLDVTPDTNLIQNGAPDAVGLRFNGVLIDAVSYEGDSGAPYTEGSGAGLEDDGSSAAQGIARCPDGSDTNVNNLDFTLAPITPGAANTCADAAPFVSSTSPANSAMDFPIGGNLSVTFSEAVDVSGAWFSLSRSVSGEVAASFSGGPTSFTLDPALDLIGGESCTLTIFAANVTDQDLNDPPDQMALDFIVGFTPFDVCAVSYTPIYDIQGEGLTAAITGTLTTQGVVVGDYEGPTPTLRGFYMQDITGDGNPATSDGVFVFNGNNDNVNLGDVVRVTGTAGEFQDQTQISNVTSIANCGSGSVAPVDVSMPFPSATYLERYEGMLVRFPQTLYVTEHFQLGRFGQVVLSSAGRLQQPTNVVDPGQPAIDLQAQNNLNRIILDDALNNQNPDPILFGRGGNPLSASNTLRGGDAATGIVGVMTYTWSGNAASGNAYRLRPINALGGGVPNFQPANPRPGSVPEVGGSTRVVGMNLLNFFNTFDGLPDTVDNCTNGVSGAPTDCRGADTPAEFERQWIKTVAAILELNPDVLGVNEIENDGYGPDSALQFLVDRLNFATAPGTYAFIDVDANTGQVDAMGNDAIKVALLYKPGVVTPIGQTAALNSIAFVNGGDSAPRSRPSIAQAFEVNATGGRFIVDVNHFKSKGSACDAPDAGDGQGNCNQVRVNAAIELVNWLAGDPTGTGDLDVLLIGDYNSYAKENPITVIKNAGYTNLIEHFLGPDAYSYVFDGQWGYLDHALGSASMTSQVTGVADYHINADEPSVLDYNTDFKSAGQITSLYAADQFRVSDHDPVIVGLEVCDDIAPTLEVSVSPDTLWTPNHKYVEVTATVTASDNYDPNPTVTLLTVTSNEPDDGEDDGNTVNDIVIVDDTTFKLRAERSGIGTGRVYTITYQVMDACGNTAVASATVTVPLSQGG